MRVTITGIDMTKNPKIAFEAIDRFSYDELMGHFEKNEPVAGTILLTLWDFRGYPDPEYVLIGDLVDLGGYGIYGISVANYEVVCSDGEYIFLNITLKKSST